MGGNIDAHPRCLELRVFQLYFQRVNFRNLTGDNAEIRCIQSRDIKGLSNELFYLGMRRRDNCHCSGRGRIHDFSAPDDDFQGIGDRHHPGDHRRRIFPGAMAKDSGGLYTKAHEHHCIGIFQNEERRNGIAGHFHAGARLFIIRRPFEHDRAQIGGRIGRHLRKAFIHCRAKRI